MPTTRAPASASGSGGAVVLRRPVAPAPRAVPRPDPSRRAIAMSDRHARPHLQPRHAPSHGTRSETPPARAAGAPAPRRPAPRGGLHAAAPTEAARGVAPPGHERSRTTPATGAL
jgi:hypothetical protein